jgi:hypothetical protein
MYMKRDKKITIAVVVSALLILAAQLVLLWTGPAAATTTTLPDRESDGDLEDVGLNTEVFTTGDNITVSGSIDDPVNQPTLLITVIDPEGQTVAMDAPQLTADDTFTYTFEAGGDDFMPMAEAPMKVGGNYRVTVQYSYGLTIEDVDLEFKYIVTPNSQPQSQGQAPDDDDNRDSGDIDEDELREELEEGFGDLL